MSIEGADEAGMRSVRTNGHTIGEMRQAMGMSHKELAIAAKCGVKIIVAAESGKQVDVNVARRIAGALGLAYPNILQSVNDD